MHGVDTMRFGATLNDSLLWRHDSPTQSSLRLENRIENRKSEVYDFAVALRELRYEDEVFYINGAATPMEWHVMSPMSDVAAVERAHAGDTTLYVLAPASLATRCSPTAIMRVSMLP